VSIRNIPDFENGNSARFTRKKISPNFAVYFSHFFIMEIELLIEGGCG